MLVRSCIRALLIVLIAVLMLPSTAFGQANTNVTINVTLTPPDASKTGDSQKVTNIRYVLLENGQQKLSATQALSSSGPNFTYTWPIPSGNFTSGNTYVIVAYPMTSGLLARYQGTGQITGTSPNLTVAPIQAVLLTVPFKLPSDSAGDMLILAALVLLALAGGMLILRQFRLRQAARIA
jgi:hypothetical protein